MVKMERIMIESSKRSWVSRHSFGKVMTVTLGVLAHSRHLSLRTVHDSQPLWRIAPQEEECECNTCLSKVYIFLRLCNHHLYLTPECSHLSKGKSHNFPFTYLPKCWHFPNLTLLEISYKWNQIIRGIFFFLLSFSLIFSRFIHVVAYISNLMEG